MNRKPESSGLVFDIQAHSVHDGPGTRTTVFLNGCPLACAWCCNPEGLQRQPVMMHRDARCVRCGMCIETCPEGAASRGPDGSICFDREVCNTCTSLACISTCYHEGMVSSGKAYTQDQLFSIFQRDRQFWGQRGGVTFSGGEPLMQRDFILPLIKRCKESRIHTCIETTGCVPSDYFMEVASLVDWIFVDIKHMDPVAHKSLTGVDNQLILKNIEALAASDANCFVVVRIPVIPDYNDSEKNMRATAQFVRRTGLEVINILPFHRLGESKYRQLGRAYEFGGRRSLERDELKGHAEWIRDEGLCCYIGWETPF